MGDRPASLTRAVWSWAAVVVLGLVSTVLVVVLRDDLIRSWAEGRRDMRRVLETQGLQAVKEGAVRPPAFVPVAIVLFVVVALLIWVLLAFLLGGYGWARHSLTALVVFLAVGTVAVIRTGPPTVFTVLGLASFPLVLAAVFFMWHRDTSAYLSAPWTDRHDEDLADA